jgi:protein-S-isoprenylcysteine O-methyltransferase Ste14
VNLSLQVVLVAAYASLAVELTLLHVPSVASTFQILAARDKTVSGYSPRYRGIFGVDRRARLLLLLPPLAVVFAVFLFPALVLIAGADPLGDYLYAPGEAVAFLGIAGIVAGRALTMMCSVSLRSNVVRAGERPPLYTRGPFRISRNPGLVGMYVFVFGIWIIMPSLAMLSGIVVYVLHMHVKVKMEEDYLANSIGAAYADYCKRTRRYL